METFKLRKESNMKILIMCIICMVLSGCQIDVGHTTKTELSWKVLRKGENNGQDWKSRRSTMEYDNERGNMGDRWCWKHLSTRSKK